MKTKREFEDLLIKYNNAYRIGEPLISDVEYDGLVHQFSLLYPDVEGLSFLQSLRDTPTDKKRKEKLPVMMTSLDKCKSVEEIHQWIREKTGRDIVDLVITAKYDGISLLTNRKKKNCWTKGVVAEQEGQRSDEHFEAMYLVDLNSFKDELTIGEAIMKRNIFNLKYSRKVGGKYSHPRNMVAGLFNANEPGGALSDVDYVCYGYPRGVKMEVSKVNQCISFSLPYILIPSSELTKDFLSRIYYHHKTTLNYDIDGLVIDINDSTLRTDCSDMASGNVGYAIAYKDPSWTQKVTTTVTGLELKPSKQGKIKPVAELEPVDIDGVEVSRVTVTNMKTVIDLKLYPGCSIEVKRSGEVIPKITKVHGVVVPQRDEIQNDKEFQEAWRQMKNELEKIEIVQKFVEFYRTIDHCLVCGSELVWDETKTELLCSDSICSGRLLAKAVYFFETLGVENFGEPSIAQIQHELQLIYPYEIMRVSAGSLLALDGWAETSVGSLLKQFNKLEIEGVPLARLLTALDLFEGKIAEKTCQLILDSIDIKELDHVLQTQQFIKEIFEKLRSIKGVSDITAQIFFKGYSEYFHHYMIRPFDLKISYIQTPKTEVKSTRFSTQQVCFTGFRNKDWEKIVVENGGKIVDSVSKNTTILVVKDLSSTSSKMKRAQELGVRVLSAIDFELRLKEEGLLN